MRFQAAGVQKGILAGVYIYLALPAVLFFAGWCRWQAGIPLAAAAVCAVVLCIREHCRDGSSFLDAKTAEYTAGYRQWGRICIIAAAVFAWTWLSGVGGYVWQNTDHPIRNEIFRLLMEEPWPVVKETDAGARGLVYYLGCWLPAAWIGRLGGPEAGWAAQYLWIAAGILLMYALFCSCRKKLSVWPLFLMIWFSGLDAAGMLLRSPGSFRVFSTLSLDEWFGYYQFSSMTTQLFWVFNQAVPAWVLCMLVFLGEKPANLVFVSSLVILTSTFPFAGMVPFIGYFMVTRSIGEMKGANGQRKPSIGIYMEVFLKNCFSLQNLAGIVVTAVSFLYIAENGAVQGSFSKLLHIAGNGAVQGSLSGALTAKWILVGFCVAMIVGGSIAVAAGYAGYSRRKKAADCRVAGSSQEITAHYRMTGSSQKTTAHRRMAGGSFGKSAGCLIGCRRGRFRIGIFFFLGIAAVAARVCRISGQMHPLRYFLYLAVFYSLEAGLLFAVLYPSVRDKKLFALTGIWLFVIPLILVGNSSDFCMRASIPGLFLLMLWCIRALEQKTGGRQKLRSCLLAAFLLIGALTPLHEMARTVVNTRNGFVNQTASEESVLMGNNFSGAAEGVFWKYLAKNPKQRR